MPPDPAPPLPAAGPGPSTSAAAAGDMPALPGGYKHQPYRPPDMPRRM
jgi:hypothetical protein